jgi:hypothetical protein
MATTLAESGQPAAIKPNSWNFVQCTNGMRFVAYSAARGRRQHRKLEMGTCGSLRLVLRLAKNSGDGDFMTIETIGALVDGTARDDRLKPRLSR